MKPYWKTFSPITLPLLPIALLYRLGNWLDRETTKPLSAPLPIISVGNATAGGAGKTPTTLALIPILKELGHTPHILTRGYKAEKPLRAHRVTDTDSAAIVGDEALLLSRAAPTWVGIDRLASAKAAHAAGATVAVCDDAHQHYRLKKNIALLVVDGPYAFGNEQLLPAGPLREPLYHALKRTDAAILIGEDPTLIAARLILPIFRATLKPADTALDKSRTYLAFAGIGRPEKFFTTLRDAGINTIANRAFPDHHTYTDADIANLEQEAGKTGATLITTEKDAVKLPAAVRAKIAVLPVTLEFRDPYALEDFLRKFLP